MVFFMVSTLAQSCPLERKPDRAVLEGLRARIGRIESRFSRSGEGPGIFSLGASAIDDALPWGGLPVAALHEVLAQHKSAASGFCAGLLARLSASRGTVLWCRRGRGGLYGPGLAAFGFAPERLILVRARNDTEVLWVLEEGLRSRSLVAVLGETDAVSMTAARRLQLAAESGETCAFLLRSAHAKIEPGPAATRWRIGAVPSIGDEDEMRPGPGNSRWRVDLLKCRSGVPGVALVQKGGSAFGLPRSWLVEWRDGTTTPAGTAAGGFAVATELRHQPANPVVDEIAIRVAV